jgi:hypothetical protein
MRRWANQRNPKGASKSAERLSSSSHLLAKGASHHALSRGKDLLESPRSKAPFASAK